PLARFPCQPAAVISYAFGVDHSGDKVIAPRRRLTSKSRSNQIANQDLEQEIAGLQLRAGDADDGQHRGGVDGDDGIAANGREERLQRGEVQPKAIEVDHVGAARTVAGEAGDAVEAIAGMKHKTVAGMGAGDELIVAGATVEHVAVAGRGEVI